MEECFSQGRHGRRIGRMGSMSQEFSHMQLWIDRTTAFMRKYQNIPNRVKTKTFFCLPRAQNRCKWEKTAVLVPSTIAVIKFHDKDKFREKGFIWIHTSRVRSTMEDMKQLVTVGRASCPDCPVPNNELRAWIWIIIDAQATAQACY